MGRGRRETGEILKTRPPQRFETVDLIDDRARGFIENSVEILRMLKEFFAQTFGRELDRRQRVFDLMSDPLGYFLPGGHLLGLEKFG